MELFRPPDTGQLFRLSAHAVGTTDASALVGRAVARSYDARADVFAPAEADGAWSSVAIGANDSTPHTLFREFPLSGPQLAAYVHHDGDVREPPFVVFAFVDVDEVDVRAPNRPIGAQRDAPPFTAQFARPVEGGSELRLHNLVADVTELVTLSCIIPPQGVVELRFYDGRYVAGREHFTPVRLKNHARTVDGGGGQAEYAFIERRLVLDRHPMRGPGSIRALVIEKGEDSPDDDVPYGFYFSGSTIR